MTEATANSHSGGLEEFNPFEDTNKQVSDASPLFENIFCMLLLAL